MSLIIGVRIFPGSCHQKASDRARRYAGADSTPAFRKGDYTHDLTNARKTGRGTVGKMAVIGAKDRKTNRVAAKVIEQTDQETTGFVDAVADEEAMVYTDGASSLPGPEASRGGQALSR